MLDCRDLACPQPVLHTKEKVDSESPQSIEILVDNQAAKENVTRFLNSQGYQVSSEPRGEDYLVSGERDPDKAVVEPDAQAFACQPARRVLVFIGSDAIGRGDDTLGAGLMKNFLATLKELGPELWRVIFVNSGVKLCCQGSESLAELEGLEKAGVSLLVCGTCLNFFKLLEQKQVGQTTNMLDVVTSLQLADKVITV